MAHAAGGGEGRESCAEGSWGRRGEGAQGHGLSWGLGFVPHATGAT